MQVFRGTGPVSPLGTGIETTLHGRLLPHDNRSNKVLYRHNEERRN